MFDRQRVWDFMGYHPEMISIEKDLRVLLKWYLYLSWHFLPFSYMDVQMGSDAYSIKMRSRGLWIFWQLNPIGWLF